MIDKTTMKLIEEFEKLYDIPAEKFTTWNFLVSVNEIVGRHENLDCLIHTNFINGNITQALCVITDWEPGAIVFQAEDGEIPKLRIVFPEEYLNL